MGTEEHHEAQQPGGREGLTPGKRARLNKVFEHAQIKASGLNPNYDYASELYAQCVLGDPGNDVYVKAYIETLQKKYNNNRSGAALAQFKERAARSAVKKALADQHWDEIIKNSVKVLAVNPWDVPALTAMAAVAKKFNYFECEMYYLKTALTVNPKDPAVNRLCAIAAAERQLIDQAIYCWHRVEEAYPDDDEPRRAISMLQSERMKKAGFSIETGDDEHSRKTGAATEHYADQLNLEKKLLKEIAGDRKQLSNYFELSQYYLQQNQFDKAEDILSQAYDISNGDPDVLERWEDVQLHAFRHNIINTADPVKKNELQQEYYHKELEFFKKRCERYPSNLFFRYDLGVRYWLTKQYNEAIRELQISRNDPRRKGVSLLALGMCFEKIKQSRLAMSHYDMAVEEMTEREVESKKEALRLAGKLALNLGEVEAAEKHLAALAAMDFTYKDVSALLDKLAELRQNQSSADDKSKSDAPRADDLRE